ncbi:hypothetical protein ACJX0J_009677, partial [Zea mays]
ALVTHAKQKMKRFYLHITLLIPKILVLFALKLHLNNSKIGETSQTKTIYAALNQDTGENSEVIIQEQTKKTTQETDQFGYLYFIWH